MPQPNIVILDENSHRGLRIDCGHGARFGEDQHLAPVTARELRQLVVEFPVFLLKNPENGHFGLFALLGFAPGRNLFLQDDRWTSQYIPLHFRRQPFLIAGNALAVGEDRREGRLAIDVSHPRVGAKGEPLFDREGAPTGYLGRIKELLSELMAGAAATEKLIEALTRLNLIAPADVAVHSGQAEHGRLGGVYTVDGPALMRLGPDDVHDLNRKGQLFAIHLLAASVANVSKMQNRS